jgi:SAM-dependent methyltransferase
MLDQFKERSSKPENIDVGSYSPAEYESCIIELQRVNRWLGDAHALRVSLLADIEAADQRTFSVLDIGAGSGELLRVIARWARESGSSAFLVGLELNARSAAAIFNESRPYERLNAVRGDAFCLPFRDKQFDYVMSSLFTHHFSDSEVVTLLKEMARVARCGIYVIDLHRHPVAYLLYTTVGRLMLHSRLLREDGALSILKSFKPAELLELGKRAGLTDVVVERHFPYRLLLKASATQDLFQKALTIGSPVDQAA